MTYAVTYGWVPVEAGVAGVRGPAPRTSAVMTGRGAPPSWLRWPTRSPEMTKVKHTYDQGIGAMKGIE